MALVLPAILPNPTTLRFVIVSNVQTYRSTFNNSTQSIEMLGDHFEFSAVWKILSREQIAPMRAFLTNLRGGITPFEFSDVTQKRPNGTIISDVFVSSAPTIESLSVYTSMQFNETIFKAGDYISVKMDDGAPDEYKMITADVITDGSGNALIPIRPTLRHAPTVGVPVVWANPKGLFVSVETSSAWQIKSPTIGDSITLNATEWMV